MTTTLLRTSCIKGVRPFRARAFTSAELANLSHRRNSRHVMLKLPSPGAMTLPLWFAKIYIHSTTPPIDGTKITEPKMAHACSAIETLKNDRPGFPQHMTSIRRVHENSHVAKMPSMWMWSYINKCLDYVEKHRKPSKTNMAVVTRRHGCMVIYHDLCRM